MCASVMFTSDCCNLCRIGNWKGVYVSKGGHTSNFEINSDQSNWMSAELSTGLIPSLRLRFTQDFERILWARLERYLDNNISEWYLSFLLQTFSQLRHVKGEGKVQGAGCHAAVVTNTKYENLSAEAEVFECCPGICVHRYLLPALYRGCRLRRPW